LIEIEPSAAGFYVRVGPFEAKEQAEHVRSTLIQLSAEARANAMQSPIPGSVLAAVEAGHQHLDQAPGHYVLRVDGGPGRPASKVELSTGGNFTHAKTA
jgi:hypothetical protein